MVRIVSPYSPKACCYTERKVLINVGNTGLRNLVQEVAQLRRHSEVGVTDFLAKLPQIHSKPRV
jgi:hypothetical protein